MQGGATQRSTVVPRGTAWCISWQTLYFLPSENPQWFHQNIAAIDMRIGIFGCLLFYKHPSICVNGVFVFQLQICTSTLRISFPSIFTYKNNFKQCEFIIDTMYDEQMSHFCCNIFWQWDSSVVNKCWLPHNPPPPPPPPLCHWQCLCMDMKRENVNMQA